MEEKLNLVYVRFDKNLDYKAVVNSYPIKKICEYVYGDPTQFITPKNFEFDRDSLEVFIQKQYDLSIDYIYERNSLTIDNQEVELVDFEPDVLIDDHLITIMNGDKVLGVISTEFDFGKIIDEI